MQDYHLDQYVFETNFNQTYLPFRERELGLIFSDTSGRMQITTFDEFISEIVKECTTPMVRIFNKKDGTLLLEQKLEDFNLYHTKIIRNSSISRKEGGYWVYFYLQQPDCIIND